jgi:hypothetical protein
MIHRRHPLQARASASRTYADEAASAAGQALDSTREFAAQALERAADKLRDLRHGMSDSTATAQREVGRPDRRGGGRSRHGGHPPGAPPAQAVQLLPLLNPRRRQPCSTPFFPSSSRNPTW